MKSFAFVFPGQGSQAVGMLDAWGDHPAVAETLREASDALDEDVARLIHERKMGPTIMVFPDCFTALGGNQYVNSSAIGNYADYLTKEIVPFVDRNFRTLSSRDHRGCFGKSSGGYGAIIHGMRYPSTWGAVADHSGDAYFDFVYWHDWPNTLNELAKYRARAPKLPGVFTVVPGLFHTG